jgi:DNA-directed RNA polymerase specialized sigma24 family protein
MAMKSRITPDQIKELVARYKKGESLHFICQSIHVSAKYAKKLLVTRGIHIRGHAEANQPPDSLVDEVIRKYRNGQTSVRIAKCVGLTSSGVIQLLRRHKVARRNRSEARGGVPAGYHTTICEKYKKGIRTKALASEYGVHQTTIYAILDLHGIRRDQDVRVTQNDRKVMVRRYKDGESAAHIGKAYGVSKRLVLDELRRRGITPRTTRDYLTRSVTTATSTKIVASYRAGQDIPALVASSDVTTSIIRRVLRENDVAIRTTRRKLSVEQESSLVQEYQGGCTAETLSRMYSVAQATVYAVLRRHSSPVRRRVMARDIEKEVVTLYEKGKSSLEIQKLCGISNSAVFTCLKRNGIASRSISIARGGIDGKCIRVVCRRYEAGESARELAKEFGVNAGTITRVLAREGVERREPGSAHDTVEQALRSQNNFQLPRLTHFYVYTLSRFPSLLKIGISFELGNRAADAEYGTLVLGYEFATRQEAHFLEEAVLFRTRDFHDCPSELLETWPGWTEIRNISIDKLRNVIESLQQELKRLGVWGFGACFVPMTAGQRHRCLDMATDRDACRATLQASQSAERWSHGFRKLLEYIDAHGDALPSRNYRTQDGFRLGSWVRNKRELREFLAEERVRALEALPGWTWSVRKHSWSERFADLRQFARETGSASPTAGFETIDGVRLGAWVATTRSRRKLLSAEQVRLLESLPGWTWDRNEDRWEAGFRRLKEYAERTGSAAVDRNHRTKDGYNLGWWANTQRMRGRKATLPVNQRQLLESLPGWSWDRRADRWTVGFKLLCGYAKTHGSASPPRRYTTSDGFTLGIWVSNLRRKRKTLSRIRRRLLESLPGWTWPARQR